MSQAPSPSFVILPHDKTGAYGTVLEFLINRFPHIPESEWNRRMASGLIFDAGNTTITARTPYMPSKRIFYFREIMDEPVIPVQEKILYHDDHILVADKPHFLPVIPAGGFVNESLLYRLKKKTGLPELAPVHRIDRETAGLVLFSINKKTAGFYHHLFVTRKVEKIYTAITRALHIPEKTRSMTIQTGMTKAEPWFLMKADKAGTGSNATTTVHILSRTATNAYVQFKPLTGKKHQVRVHATTFSKGIVHDRWYPELLPRQVDDFNRPLQLLAHGLSFQDPITHRFHRFQTGFTLSMELLRNSGTA